MKKMPLTLKYLVLIGLFLCTINAVAQDPNFHIYLCFGQSNMEGQGVIEEQDRIIAPRFKVLQSLDCPDLERKKQTWHAAIPPLSQYGSGLSPADYFGKTLVKKLPDSIKVGVINVAVGGCDIRLFDKDLYTAHDATYTEDWFTNKVKAYGGNPYAHLLQLAKRAQQDGVIKGVLLHQGETNTGDTQWPTYVKKIYEDLLIDLSLPANSIPLLAGELVSIPNSCCDTMNSIINTLPEVLPNAYVVSSKDCTAQDNAHFDAAGYRELGTRYAVQMLALYEYC